MGAVEKYDQLMKFIVIGDSGTGKSCLLHRFIENKFVEDQTHTIGVEFGAKVVDLLGKRVKLQIWDTAGQERYRSVTRSYYRGAMGCLLVYDISCRESYEHVPQWLADARNLAGKDIVVMLVGNKADVGTGDSRQVTHIEASQFAQQNGLMMFETSAVTGEFVEEAFVKVAKTALMRQQEERSYEGGGSLRPAARGADVGGGGGQQERKKGCSC
eukprot:TRINITY_DN3033_c0_g1_i1.p1 TRINITY_DN3033_c0_g1~~TRINITY_DN3033_c0_g1_i1.p1  ORF type:complete len:245 (+),score=72.69 TRINITY_DN3033_c0_g1_i1:96-737(+)